MADILPFAKAEPGRRKPPGGSAGEIVIFPGVRVEYHDRPAAPEGNGGPRRRRRPRVKEAAASA
jgi:hypothetical protein